MKGGGGNLEERGLEKEMQGETGSELGENGGQNNFFFFVKQSADKQTGKQIRIDLKR